ncbi:MAG: hypothetical protein HNEKOMLI_00442 [Sodalis sp. Psp]|nr:hypothetical protein [Sodalis sp. Psp]MCR3756918.1 hypothetical protein [Sodalis sp. Ppy]
MLLLYLSLVIKLLKKIMFKLLPFSKPILDEGAVVTVDEDLQSGRIIIGIKCAHLEQGFCQCKLEFLH